MIASAPVATDIASAARIRGSPKARSVLAGRTAYPVRLAMLLVWLGLVAWLEARHVFWRDEVRALNLALSGDGIPGMIAAVHGEGHPALWYLLLRVAHMVAPVREVLPATGLAIGIAGAAVVALRAPFRPGAIAAILFGAWFVFEYTVMARNYGISMLLMVVLADRFGRGRDGAVATGALLFLLCNTNVPSVIIAGAFLLFWLVEIVSTTGIRRSPALGRLCIAAACALAGVVTCFLEVYPPFNDAAVSPLAATASLRVLIGAAFNVTAPMSYMMPEIAWGLPAAPAVLAVLMIASPFSLARAPGALAAALVGLPGFLLFFQLVYPGSYRHQALYLCFLVILHWMVARGRGGRWTGEVALSLDRLARIGGGAFAVLLAIQLVPTASLIGQTLQGRVSGQTAELSRLLGRPDLRGAIVMAHPDFMVEPLSYYAANPTWLSREHRFGAVTHFTRHAELDMTLAGTLATARRLHARTGRPIVILLELPVDPRFPVKKQESYVGSFEITADQARSFLAATRRLARPADVLNYSNFDESYDVYLLTDPGR